MFSWEKWGRIMGRVTDLPLSGYCTLIQPERGKVRLLYRLVSSEIQPCTRNLALWKFYSSDKNKKQANKCICCRHNCHRKTETG